MSCKNCMGGCIHAKTEEKKKKVEFKDENGKVWMVGWEHDGYHHFCDKNPKGYDKWHELHKNDSYDTYKTDAMDCYEPNEYTKSLNNMKKLLEELLEISQKKNK